MFEPKPMVAFTLGAMLALPISADADPPRRRRGRTPPAAATPETPELPQDCAMDPFHADYGPLTRGSRVRLGRHREVDGDAYWAEAMDSFVGRVTTITGPRGVDEQGCPLVAVAADDGEFDWRVRDLTVVSDDARDALSNATLSPGFAGDPRAYEGRLITDYRASSLHEGCAGWTSREATLRLTLTEDFETISFLAHAEADLVLVIHTPDDAWICADDVDDLDPVIAGSAGEGSYEIWVGGYDNGSEGAPFRVGVSEKLTVRTRDLEDVNAAPLGERQEPPMPYGEGAVDREER